MTVCPPRSLAGFPGRTARSHGRNGIPKAKAAGCRPCGNPGDYHHSGRHDRTPDPDVAAGSRGLHREAFRAGDCDAQSGKCSGRWQTVETDVCCRRKG